MFYQFAAHVLKGIIWLINGKVTVLNKDKVPKGEYVLVGPHRTWWDPLFFAAIGFPTVYMFMAKKELFKNKIIGWIIKHANGFPVDRDNPGPSVIKIPVKGLKKRNMSLIIFPSGSRHSSDMKDGALLIAKLAKKPIVPLVYQGPLTFGGLFKRNNVTLSYGDPIDPSSFSKDKKIASQEFDQTLKNTFKKIDQSINPNFIYIDQKK